MSDGIERTRLEPELIDETTIRLYGVGPKCPGCGGPTHCVGEGGERPWWCQSCNVRLDDEGEYGSQASFPAGDKPNAAKTTDTDDDLRTDGGVVISDKRRNASTVRPDADLLVALPEPPATFRRREINETHHDDLDRLIAKGAIECVDRERERREGGGANHPWRYRVAEWARHHAEEQVASRDAPMPCGHAGIRNLGGEYTCALESCELTYSRGEVDV